MPTREDLQILQSQDLELKIMLTKQRIREWVTAFSTSGVYISFSGGKDSTVLLHLVREVYPDVEAVFVNTGLEYPEIQRFVKTFDNVRILYPKKTFKKVLSEHGYPIIGKEIAEKIYYAKKGSKWAVDRMLGKRIINGYKTRYNYDKWADLLNVDFNISSICCNIMKKKPAKQFEKQFDKKPILATLAEESLLRTNAWIRTGCNAFESKRPLSKPMSFWSENDVLQYIRENNIKIASVYGDVMPIEGQTTFDCIDCKYCTTGEYRTGCIFCGFGAHLEKGEGKFQRLKRTHPKQYDFCINGGAYDEDGLWKPDSRGLGMGHVFDELNKLYGEDFIRFK